MMNKLHSVTIDVGVLEVPGKNCDKSDALQYVDTLREWSDFICEPWIASYTNNSVNDYLGNPNIYDKLQNIFGVPGADQYDANTVGQILYGFLKQTSSFEDYYQVKYALLGPLETDPEVVQLKKSGYLRDGLAQCITLVAILRKHCKQPLLGHSLILSKAPMQKIQVKAHIHDLEHSRDDIPNLPYPPDFFEGNVLAYDDFRNLIKCLDASAILVDASDDHGVELAIRTALFKNAMKQGEALEWDSEIIPIIGSKFRDSCQKCCAEQGGSLPTKILRSIVETMKGENLSDVHAIRTRKGGNSQQKRRGVDKAQRRDIDYEFHLHYWESPDGGIELASVVYHNDFSIPT